MKWAGQHLENLLTKTVEELLELYPQKDRNYLQTIKRYHERKTMEKEGRLSKTWEAAAFDKEQGEWVHTELHSYDHSGDPVETFEAASPARITPSRKKVPTRNYNVIYAFSDAQIDYRRLDDGSLEPLHDERALAVSRLICRDVQPDYIINLGDTVDLASLSRFAPDSDHFHRTLGPSFQRVHDMYAELRSDNPSARIIEVDSNHNTRLKKFALKHAPQLYNMHRAGDDDEYPVLSYPYLANLNHLNVEWISGYGAAEFVYGEDYDKPPIVFKHGVTMASSGSTALKESKENAETHVVRGHGHRIEMHTRTNRAGQYLSSIMLGALCRIDGIVPGYHSAVNDRNEVVKKVQNWQNSACVIFDYGGDYQFDIIPIREGTAYYNGKEYNGNIQ